MAQHSDGERDVAAFVERARALIGTRFRPQGRSPALGIDCIGLASLIYEIPAGRIRSDYRLRGGRRCEVETGLRRFFETVEARSARVGDLLLVEPGPAQLHLLVLVPEGYIHADAGLRRVVEVPDMQPYRLLSAWRRLQPLGEC